MRKEKTTPPLITLGVHGYLRFNTPFLDIHNVRESQSILLGSLEDNKVLLKFLPDKPSNAYPLHRVRIQGKVTTLFAAISIFLYYYNFHSIIPSSGAIVIPYQTLEDIYNLTFPNTKEFP